MRTLAAAFIVGFALSAAAATTTHEPKGSVGAKSDTRAKSLSGFCLDGQDRLITADDESRCLRLISPDDKLVRPSGRWTSRRRPWPTAPPTTSSSPPAAARWPSWTPRGR